MIVVTGASGHVGNTLVKMLLAEGRPVTAMLHENTHPESLKGVQVKTIKGDVLDKQSLIQAFTGAETVIHCAALISIVPGIYDTLYDINVKGTEHVIEACRLTGVKRLVYISSIEAIGDVGGGRPATEEDGFDPKRAMIEYGETKALASLKVLEAVKNGLDAVMVAPVGVVGPNDYKPSQMGKMVLDFVTRKLPAYPGGGFYFVYVRDVARLIILAMDKGRTGELYLATGEHLTIPQMMSLLEEITGIKKPRFQIPYWVTYMGALGAEAVYKVFGGNPIFTRGSIRIIESNLRSSGEKARREFGFEPTPLKKTFADQIEWFKNEGIVPKS